MNEHLKIAIEAMGAIKQLAAEKETEAMSFAVSYAQAAAAIAQADAAERQAGAMEKIASLLADACVKVQDGERAFQTLDYFTALRNNA